MRLRGVAGQHVGRQLVPQLVAEEQQQVVEVGALGLVDGGAHGHVPLRATKGADPLLRLLALVLQGGGLDGGGALGLEAAGVKDALAARAQQHLAARVAVEAVPATRDF